MQNSNVKPCRYYKRINTRSNGKNRLIRNSIKVQLHVELEIKMPRKMYEKVNEMEYTIHYYKSICGKKGSFLSVNLTFI